MSISDNFSQSELCASSTADKLGIDNTPNEHILRKLAIPAVGILEPCRAHFNTPFVPSSGYRCQELNDALAKRKNTISQHILGEAIDFEIPGVDNYRLAYWISKNLHFDQIILERYTPGIANSGWVHVSLKQVDNRKEILTFRDNKYLLGFVL